MIAELLKRVRLTRQTKQQGAAQTWQTLVADVVDGKMTNPVDVADMLDGLDKTDADLEAAVELLTTRRSLAATVEAGAKADQDIVAVNKGLAEADAWLAEQHDKYNQRVAPLRLKHDQMRQLSVSASYASAELQRTCTDEAILAELESIRHRSSEIQAVNFDDVRRQIEHNTRQLADVRSHNKIDRNNGVDVSKTDEEIIRLEAVIDDLQGQIDANAAEMTKLNERADALLAMARMPGAI